MDMEMEDINISSGSTKTSNIANHSLFNVNSSKDVEPVVSNIQEDHQEIDIKVQDLKTHIKEKSREDKSGMVVEASHLSFYIDNPIKTNGFSFKSKTERVYLLKDLTFYLKPGRMVLLMGAPSSGKSVLLKTLANRLGKGKKEGTLLFNQHEPDEETHQRDTIYVTQEDRHIALLTVRETLEFSARCNMGESANELDINERVDIILDQLGISHTANTIVGNEFFRGISGGQKRRVTIASEFTKCPNLILMDEPTTGLDSHSSFALLSKVKCISKDAKTSTIVSLLQPSPELTQLFDDVLLLGENGTLAYFGPFDQMLNYFSSISLEPLPNQPIAEFMQEVVFEPNKYIIGSQILQESTSSNRDTEGASFTEKINLAKKFQDSKYSEKVDIEMKSLYSNNIKLTDYSMEKDKIENTSTLYQTWLCLGRHWKVMKIMKMQYAVRFFQALFMGFVVGTLFYQMTDTQADARNRFGLLYFSMVLHIWTCIGCIEEYFTLRGIFYDQSASKYYGPFPFFLSLTITKIPVAFIEALLYSIMCYWLAGFRATGDAFIVFVLGMMFTNLISQGIFQTVSVFLENALISSLVNPAVIVVCMILSGYILPKPDIPGWYIWLHYLTPLKYVLEMLSSNEMVDRKFGCAESELIPPKNYPNFTEPYPYGYNGQQICPGSNGNDFLDFFGMPENSYFRWIDLVITIAYIIALFSVFYLGIRFIRFEIKKPPKFIKPKKAHNKKEKIRASKHVMTGCYMTFNNLGYTVESKKKNIETGKDEKVTLELLQNITGFVTPGMMALMGPSGAGKSTLLDVFSRRKNMGVMSGEIKINNKPIDSINLTRFTGYVEQIDILPANLTVREAIEFNAKCRLPATTSEDEMKKMIDNIIVVLSLVKIQNMKIGTNPTVGISLANRKKVSIGIELAADPHLLFLDEPTSSLDSSDAIKVMNCVKRIANSGRTIICTIHQPSAEIFEKFDQLLLLDKGQTIYFGETGKNSEKVLDYFTSQGYQYTPGRNPADFILEVSEQYSSNSKFNPPIQHYSNSVINQDVVHKLNNDYGSIVPHNYTVPNYKSVYSSSFSTQLRCLLRRSWLNHIRRPQTILLRFLRSFVPSVIIGTMFLQIDNDQSGARNQISMVYLSFLFGGMASIGKIPVVVEDRAVYYRDQSSNTYPSVLYLLASFVTDLPMMLLTAFSYWIPFFWLTGLDGGHNGWKFFFTLATYCIVIMCYDNLSMFFAFALPTVPVATLINSMSLNFLALFSGFFIPKPSIKVGWIWMYHLVFTKYSLESLVVTVLKGQTFSCPDNEGAFPIPVGNNQTKIFCPIQTGETMLEQYGFDDSRQYINILIISCYGIAYLIFCYFALVFVKHIKR